MCCLLCLHWCPIIKRCCTMHTAIFFPLTLLVLSWSLQHVALFEEDQELCTCGTTHWQPPGMFSPKDFRDSSCSSMIAEIIRTHNKE